MMLMRSRLLIAIAALSVLAAAPAAAQASVLDRLYAPLHIHPKAAPSPSFIRSHFPTITIQRAQLRKGYRSAHTGFYTKGTRSRIGSYPDSWYLHTAGGARVRDRARGFYVMDPSSRGWRRQVVRNCKGSPSFCFLDAMGSDGYSRTNVRPSVSLSWWTKQTLGLASYVSNASRNWGVAANNLLAARGANYMVAYEMFARVSASRSLDVLRHTKCLCFAKLGTVTGARYGFTLFLSGYGRGDRISVGTDQQAGKWWDFFKRARQLGKPTAKLNVNGTIITRAFKNGMVVVNTGSSAQPLGRVASRIAGASKIVKAHSGRILLR
jgi:hypothetical protein